VGDPAKSSTTPRRSRRVVVAVALVVASVLTPLSVLAVWGHRVVLETDQYVATVNPLVRSSVIDHAVAKRAADAVSELVDRQGDLASVLPPAAQKLLPRLVEGVHSAVERVTLEIIQSKQFDKAWSEINRTAHVQVVKVLTGRGKVRVVDGDKVVLDLAPLAQEAAQRVKALGIPGIDGQRLQSLHPQLVLFQSGLVGPVQFGVRLLDTLAYVLPVVALALFALALSLSTDRRRSLVRAGIGVAVGLGVLLAGLRVGRQMYLDYVDSAKISVPAAAAAFDIVLEQLRRWLTIGFVTGAAVVLGAWLAGPARLAVAMRGAVARPRAQTAAATVAPQASMATFVTEHRAGLQVLVVMAGLAVFVPFSHPTLATFLIIALVVAAVVTVVGLVARRDVAHDPDPRLPVNQ